MFSEKYLKENFERSWGKVDPTKLNWDVVKEERMEESTVLWALDEDYVQEFPVKEENN